MASQTSFCINQAVETPLQHLHQGPFHCRYAYVRAADTIAAGEKGQDYFAYRIHPDFMTFVLCDGVSQSYCGDLAASWLGNALLGWLDALDMGDASHVLVQLQRFLSEQVAEATAWLNRHQLPANLSPFLRALLTEKRQEGSATTYVCGRLELPRQGLSAGRLMLAWQGDSRFRLWDRKGLSVGDFHATFTATEQWSTKRGPVGHPHVTIQHLADLAPTLATYSDGLQVLDACADMPCDSALASIIENVGKEPTSDDISFLEIRWDGPGNHWNRRCTS